MCKSLVFSRNTELADSDIISNDWRSLITDFPDMLNNTSEYVNRYNYALIHSIQNIVKQEPHIWKTFVYDNYNTTRNYYNAQLSEETHFLSKNDSDIQYVSTNVPFGTLISGNIRIK